MTGPMQQAGATVEPSEYAPLAMDEQFTGLFTQANPIRDAAVPYLVKKFYAGSRFDRIIDGINREITSKLTDKRRPGSPLFNQSTFPGVTSFYAWKYIQSSVEVIRLILDGQDGNVYDFTPNVVGGTGSVNILSKSGGAASRPAAFCGVNTQLFYGDGVSNLKWTTTSKLWQALTNFKPGTLIATGTPENGSIQMAVGGVTVDIIASESDGTSTFLWIAPQLVPQIFPNLEQVDMTFSGLTAGSALNGGTYPISIVSTTLGLFKVAQSGGAYSYTNDTGSGTTGDGTSGNSLPSFSNTEYLSVLDAGQQWKYYGPQKQNHGLVAPTQAALILTGYLARFWAAGTEPTTGTFAILDNDLNVQMTTSRPGLMGTSYPQWGSTDGVLQTFVTTNDGAVQWTNYGKVGSWSASTAFGTIGAGGIYASTWVILDSNGNWQLLITPGTSDTSAPAWATTIGASTTDNTATWLCLGPGTVITTETVQYSFSLHAIDGTVSTAAPLSSIIGPIVGPSTLGLTGDTTSAIEQLFVLDANFTWDPQQDQIWIWRTAQGQSTLVLEDQIPVDHFASGQFVYGEIGISDTSTNGNGALNALIAAPIADSADPPPAGFLPLCFHLGRLWGVIDNTVVYSAGPDAVVGNGNTQFPPANVIPFVDMPILCFSSTTTQGPTLMVWTTGGLQAVYGDGTATSPFTGGSTYMARSGILSRFAVDMVGSTLYAMTSSNKVCSYDPSGGYQEIGFPIGDQFEDVTTGAGDAATGALYDPASTYVSWYERNSGDTRLFVSDGAVGWFSYMPTTTPETGGLWNTRAAIVGGTSAVQAIETAPGIFTLLIGPPNGTPGPILMRDTSRAVFGDGAGASAYHAWDTKGSITLCETGEVAEIAHIALKSVAVGARPTVSILLDEIQAGLTIEGETTAFDVLEFAEHHEDPPNLDPSISMYSDRYNALQGGGGSGPAPQGPKCDNFQMRIDYGTQAVGDELLKFAVFGAVHKERLQQ